MQPVIWDKPHPPRPRNLNHLSRIRNAYETARRDPPAPNPFQVPPPAPNPFQAAPPAPNPFQAAPPAPNPFQAPPPQPNPFQAPPPQPNPFQAPPPQPNPFQAPQAIPMEDAEPTSTSPETSPPGIKIWRKDNKAYTWDEWQRFYSGRGKFKRAKIDWDQANSIGFVGTDIDNLDVSIVEKRVARLHPTEHDAFDCVPRSMDAVTQKLKNDPIYSRIRGILERLYRQSNEDELGGIEHSFLLDELNRLSPRTRYSFVPEYESNISLFDVFRRTGKIRNHPLLRHLDLKDKAVYTHLVVGHAVVIGMIDYRNSRGKSMDCVIDELDKDENNFITINNVKYIPFLSDSQQRYQTSRDRKNEPTSLQRSTQLGFNEIEEYCSINPDNNTMRRTMVQFLMEESPTKLLAARRKRTYKKQKSIRKKQPSIRKKKPVIRKNKSSIKK